MDTSVNAGYDPVGSRCVIWSVRQSAAYQYCCSGRGMSDRFQGTKEGHCFVEFGLERDEGMYLGDVL